MTVGTIHTHTRVHTHARGANHKKLKVFLKRQNIRQVVKESHRRVDTVSCEILTSPREFRLALRGTWSVHLFCFSQWLFKVVFISIPTIFRKIIANVLISSSVVNKITSSLRFLPGDFGVWANFSLTLHIADQIIWINSNAFKQFIFWPHSWHMAKWSISLKKCYSILGSNSVYQHEFQPLLNSFKAESFLIL